MGSLSIPLVVVLAAVMVAAVTDFRAFKIHNLLTLPLLVSGLVFHGIAGGPGALAESVVGVCFGFGITLVMFVLGGMGGGDVKLMAGVGAWLGAPATFLLFVAASLATGVYALVVIAANGRFRQTWVNFRIMLHRAAVVGRHLVADDHVEEVVQKDDRRSRLVPFGAMLAVGLISLLLLVQLRHQSEAAHAPRNEPVQTQGAP